VLHDRVTMNSGSVSSNLRTLRSTFEPILRSMRGGANLLNPNTPGNVPMGVQLIETFVIVVVLSLSINLIESSYTQLQKYQSLSVDVYPLTYNSPQIFIQDPSSCFPILEPSNDERNGLEYSYSCFINLSANNFTEGTNTFRHVFHKGSPGIYPLMAPGVFFRADTNTLRVYQNSTLTWNNYVDIPNIPLNKWFHLVVMLKGSALDVYINGNLANRKKFTDVPKLNYGNFYLLNGTKVGEVNVSCTTTGEDVSGNVVDFSSSVDYVGFTLDSSGNRVKTASDNLTVGTDNSKFIVVGHMSGYVSRVKYFAFALTYAQIDKLLREGPSKKIYQSKRDPVLDDPNFSLMPVWSVKPQAVLPFYQTDDWWTSDVHSGLGPQ